MPSPHPPSSSSSIHQEHHSIIDFHYHSFLPQSPPPFFTFSPSLRRRRTAPKANISSSLDAGSRSSKLQALWNEFNRFVTTHCERTPLGFGFASVGVSPSSSDGTGGAEIAAEEDGVPTDAGVGSEQAKKVLILMSDPGGGHRASAEAIKAAFNQEFGDEYQVFVTDLWTDHTPWPFNQLPRSYNFLVKHGTLWRMTYYGSAPKLVHQPHFAATSAFIAR